MPDDLLGKFSDFGLPDGDDRPDERENFSPINDASREGVVPLGHDRGTFYYLSNAARQVFGLTYSQHSKTALMAMASGAHHWQRSRFVNEKGAVNWDEAIDFLMGECRRIGIYNQDRVRGRGAWMDDGRSVLHVGDQLLVDGKPSSLLLPNSKFVYEAASHLTSADAEPLSSSEANQLVKICNMLRWEKPINGTLLAGFIAIAPICGGLNWRPSIWITGGSGSGKSYLKDNILSPALGGIALLVQSKTSEAGIRQTLGCDARPVIFDEAEAEDQSAVSRMQGVLDLMRQSSSEGGADIVKGSAQGAAKRYRIRSVFCFSSINVGIQHQADANRISILALREQPSAPSARASSEADFQKLNALVVDTITAEFSAGLLARSVRLLPIIRQNAETFARAVSIHLGSRRMGDQIGALLAGAYSLHASGVITSEAALKYIKDHDWSEATAANDEKDEAKLLSLLTQHSIKFNGGNGATDATIGRLILGASGGDRKISKEIADLELRQIGIRAVKREDGYGVYISINHPALRKILTGTPWASNWSRSLARLPNAGTGQQNYRFAFGHQSKAVWIPMTTIDPKVEGDEEEI